jgi:uncharacterized protein
MTNSIISLIMGVIFGASLLLAALTDPDKIIGSLRFKDFHALRTVIVAVLVAMIGTWLLGLGGAANVDIKPAVIVPVLIGGAFVGIGLGLTGFGPGTSLACAASGRIDALAAVIGMFFGAHLYILIYPAVVVPLQKVLNYGQATLPQITSTSQIAWMVPIFVVGLLALVLTRSGKTRKGEAPAKATHWGLTQNASATRSQMLAADGLEAVGVFRAWKNFLFVVAVVCLALLQAIFWLAHTGQIDMDQHNPAATSKPVPSTSSGQALRKVEGPKPSGTVSSARANANPRLRLRPGASGRTRNFRLARSTAASPATPKPSSVTTSRLLPFDLTFEHVASVVGPVNGILVLACVLYGLTMFSALTVSIAGEITGLGQIARAFYLSVIVLILLLPWQTIFVPGGFGTIYTPAELAHACTAHAAGAMKAGLFYVRFSGIWALTLLVLIQAQWRTCRWTRAALSSSLVYRTV